MRPRPCCDLAAQARRPPARRPDLRLRRRSCSARDEKGWFRFQRLYDIARACVRDESDVRRLVLEAAAGRRRATARAGWSSRSTPTSYAVHLGGLTPTLEIMLDEAADTPLPQRGRRRSLIVVAASRMRHPLDARTLARLAAQHAGDGAGRGRRVRAEQRRAARATRRSSPRRFRIARRAGLALVPHSGELLGPDRVETTLDRSGPDRIGHGVRVGRGPAGCSTLVAERGITLEVCPGSNVALGVYGSAAGGAAARDRRARHTGRAGRRRPAALRLAAGRPVRARPRRHSASPTTSWPSWPAARSAARAPPTTSATPALADIDAWLAAPAD